MAVSRDRFGRPTNPLRSRGVKVTEYVETLPLEALLAPGVRERCEVTPVTEETPSDEFAWVQKARKSDRRAFESLYRLHVDKVYGLCLRMTGNASEAEDCTQETFIQAWTRLDRFRGDSSFGTWLHRVAVNTVLGRMRKSRRERDRIRAVTEVAPVNETIGDSGGLEDLEKAMNELPSGARHVFVLHAVYGYSHDETSEMLGIASGTSKAQLHRARRLLAQQLNVAV
jgi:RNA polymerase sigma-70 factor, ECF subfamily